MTVRFKPGVAAMAIVGALALPIGLSVQAQDAALKPFPEQALGNPEYIEVGKDVFGRTCKFCHGRSAYPGKGPVLNPSRYNPEFVFDRVTNGFRGMPSMKEMLSEKERQGVTAYVMSQGFAN